MATPTFSSASLIVERSAVSAPSHTSWLTSDRVLLMNNMSAALAGVSLLFCLVVIGIVAILFTKDETRRALDRLSFRILMWALISNCIYSIGYIICVKASPGFWCAAGVWLIQFWLGVTNWLVLCIALNLQLVLVNHVKVIGFEKWYISGTFVLNLAITLPPLIKGKFGWDPVIQVCWLHSNTSDNRLKWQIATQYFWIILSVVITAMCAAATTLHLYKHKFKSLPILRKQSQSSGTTASRRSSAPDNRAPKKDNTYRTAGQALVSSAGFRKIILRISMYPVIMIVLNLVITIADIRISTMDGIYTQNDYALYTVYYALYGARGIFYAIIALLDPSIIRAIRIWRGVGSNSSFSAGQSATQGTNCGGTSNVETEFEQFVEELGYSVGQEKPIELSPTTPAQPGITVEINGAEASKAAVHVKTKATTEAEEEMLAVNTMKDDWANSDVSLANSSEETEGDTSSIADLAPSSQIEEIRRTQQLRTKELACAERMMKMQI